MLRTIRHFARRVERREPIAVALTVAAAAIAVLMALPGGRAYLDQPCNPLHRPSIDETRRSSEVVVAPEPAPVAVFVPASPPPATIITSVVLPASDEPAPIPLAFIAPIAPPRGPPCRRVV